MMKSLKLNPTTNQLALTVVLLLLLAPIASAQDNFGIEPVGSFFDRWNRISIQSIHGNLACFSDGYNFRLVDVSNPEAAQSLAILKTSEAIGSLFSGDSLLYLFHALGWSLVDIANPSEPEILWDSTNVTEVFHAVTEGDLLCISGRNQNGISLCFYDISNPREPHLMSSIQLGRFVQVYDIVMNSDFAYLVLGDEIIIYDLRDPEDPRLSDRVIPRQAGSRLYVNENKLCIVSFGGLTIYDLADPENPESIGHYACRYQNFTLPATFIGEVCYLTLPDTSLKMLDISDPGEIVEIDSVRHDNLPKRLIINDNRLYASFTDSLVIYELSERQLPQPLGTYRPDLGFIYGLTNTDNRIFFSSGLYNRWTIETLNIDNPLNPTFIENGRFDSADMIRRLFLDDRRLYAVMDDEVRVFDVESSSSPLLMPVTIPAQSANKILQWGEYSVVLDQNDLVIFRQTDTLEYAEVSRFVSGQEHCLDIAVSRQRAFMLFYYNGIMVIDLSDPSNPRQVSLLRTRHADGIIAHEDYLFAFGNEVVSYLINEEQSLQPIDTLAIELHYSQPTMSGGFIACSGSRDDQAHEFAIAIIDCNNPNSLRLTGYLSSQALEILGGIVIKDNYVYAGTLESLAVFDCSEALSLPEAVPFVPGTLHLDPPYPNPFNSSVTISYTLPSSSLSSSSLRIYDLSGRLVADLTNSAFRTPHSASGKVVWNAKGLGSGVYLVRLESETASSTQKIVLMR